MSPHTPSIARSSSPASTILPPADTVATPLSPTTATPESALHTKIWRWIQGPDPPKDITFKPLFPEFQRLPEKLLRRGPLKQKRWRLALLIVYWLVWLTAFIIVVHNSRFLSEVGGAKPYALSCAASLWSKNSQCGLNGDACRPFTNSTMPFRCPAQCAGTNVLNPRAVGDQSIIYKPFVIGGPTPNMTHSSAPDVGAIYRSDSFICASAIHAGIISNKYGGCGVFSMIGEQHDFPASKHHGIQSVPFDASFPSSFTFLSGMKASHCQDLRWHLLAVSLTFTTLLSIFTSSTAILVSTLFPSIFFHVAMASDPPMTSNPYDLVSIALSRFFPAAFVVYVLYTHVLHYTLSHPHAPIERTVLWVGGIWVGALNNITIDPLIPIARLTARDINQQPGAITALVVICLLLTSIVLVQAHYFRLEGRLPRFLALYAIIGVSLGFLSAIPGSSLRLHHYILGVLLLPGTKMRTRVSLLCGGLLLGLFINGTARWGFAGIVETPEALRGDGLYFSSVPVLVPAEVGAGGGNVTFAWRAGRLEGWEEGVSVIVDDVERGRIDGVEGEVAWNRTWRGEAWEKVYVRVGYYGSGGEGDYTMAGVLEEDGRWKEPVEGRT